MLIYYVHSHTELRQMAAIQMHFLNKNFGILNKFHLNVFLRV